MAKPFLIVGLPRSRTAWLAAVANTVPGAICYHEPFMRYPKWQDSLALWSGRDNEWVGLSDSSMGFHLGEILRDHSPRVLIIERSIGDVVSALRKKAIGGDQLYRQCAVLLDRVRPHRAHPLVKVASYSSLTDSATVRSCLWHLMPGASIDGDKITEMQRLNVQVHLETHRKEVERADAPALLGDAYAELCV